MKSLTILFAIFYMATSFAQAPDANCNNVNLITQANSPFNRIPVYDQDGNNMCYAYSTAQLVDYHLISNGATARNIHPAWAAIVQARVRNRSYLTGGQVARAVEGLRTLRNCDYSIVERELARWAQQAHVTEAEMLQFLDMLSYQMHHDQTTLSTGIRNAGEESQFPGCSANPAYDELTAMIERLNVTSFERFAESVLLTACSNNRSEPQIPVAILEGGTGEEMINSLSARLSENRPVSINYCMNFWRFPRFIQATKNGQTSCSKHESIVVGKKMIGGSCHYLIRNSWGNGFDLGAENYTCVCRHRQTGAMVEECRASTHNDGHYSVEGCWINSRILTPNISGITYLQR
jgi:hypothetical protein